MEHVETVILDIIVVQDMCPKLFKEYTVIDIENNWNTMKHSILQLSYFTVYYSLSHGQDSKYHPCHEAKYKDLDPKDWGARSVDIWKWEKYGGQKSCSSSIFSRSLYEWHVWPDSTAKKGLARHRVPQGHYRSSLLVANGVSWCILDWIGGWYA